MIIDILRGIGLFVFIIVIFTDINIPIVLNTSLNQLILALIVIITIIAIDEIVGFLLGLILLVIYYKYYQKIFNNSSGNINNINNLNEPLLNNKNMDTFENDVKPIPNNKIASVSDHYIKFDEKNNCIEMPHISNELLEKAQTNIYDATNYNMELVSNDNNKIYGIQGLNSSNIHFPAFDKNYIELNYIY